MGDNEGDFNMDIQASLRTKFGKSEKKKLKKEGLTPGIIYGSENEPLAISFDPRTFEKIFRKKEAGVNTIVNIVIDGDKKTTERVMTHIVDRNAISRNIEHIDFIRVDEKRELTATVPIVLNGSAPGLKTGGMLIQKIYSLKVRCLPSNIPNSIDIDMSKLELGEFIRVKDYDTKEQFKFLINDNNETIVRIASPRKIEETEGSEGNEAENTEVKEASSENEKPSEKT